jgi:hypothetical protein
MDEATRLVQAKGAILDPDAIPGLDMDAARNQRSMGRATPEVQAAYEEFYGLRKPGHLDGGDALASPRPDPAKQSRQVDLDAGNPIHDAIREELAGIVRRVSGEDAEIRFNDYYQRGIEKPEWGGDGSKQVAFAGLYQQVEDVITINGVLEGGRDKAISTAFHESFHRLQYGLLTEAEMKVMDSAFGIQRINSYSELNPSKIATIERMAVAFENYATARYLGGDAMKEGMMEALAGSLSPKWASRVVEVAAMFEKVLAFIEQFKNFAKGNGFTSVDDIFDRAFSGEIAKRRVFDSALEMIEPDQLRRIKMLDRWRRDAKAPAADIGAAIAKIDSQVEALKAKATSGGC